MKRTRIERYMAARFGRDLSGGADWSTDGAWKAGASSHLGTGSGTFLVCEARGGIGLDVWSVVRRSVTADGNVIDVTIGESTSWSAMVRDALRFSGPAPWCG